MTISLIEAPSVEPLTLNEIKAHLRVTHNDEDDQILDIVRAARELVEQQIGQFLIRQVWRQYEDGDKHPNIIDLKVKPIKAVRAITVYGQDGEPIELSTDHYELKAIRRQVKILASPMILDCSNGIELDLEVGMATTGNEVPDALKRAIFLLSAHWYEFRGAVPISQQPISIPHGFEILISPYRRIKL